jgi:hypothetical protein
MMMNWKGSGRKRSRHNFKVLSKHSPGVTEENHENLNQDSRSPGRDLNLDLPNTKQECQIFDSDIR